MHAPDVRASKVASPAHATSTSEAAAWICCVLMPHALHCSSAMRHVRSDLITTHACKGHHAALQAPGVASQL